MDKNLLDLIVPALETEPDFYIPAKKLWNVLKKGCNFEVPPFEDFINLLKKDNRFVLENTKNVPWDEDPEETAQMEELGYYAGPKVRLSNRVPTKNDVERIVLKQTQKIIDSLVKAYAMRPKDIPEEEEGQLIDAMAKAKKLKEELQKAFKDEK